MEDSPSVSPEVQAEQEALIRKIRNAENHYEVLDLERDCTCEAVVKKFRRMALRLHPDKCALEGGHEAYAAMDLANQTLADPEKRKKYDYLLTLHRGRFLPDIDNHSEGGFDEGEGEAPEGGYIRTFGIGFIVCMATVGLYLYARLKVELAGFVTGRDGLPLHAWCVAVLLSLTAGLDWLEVLKWSFVTYFATKGAEMVPWIQLIQFQLDNANNMYGVPCWIGLNMVALSYHYLGFDAMSAVLFGILETVVVGIAILRSDDESDIAKLCKWVGIYGIGLFGLAYMAGLSGAIAAGLALVMYSFGASMPGATIGIFAIIILFFAYKIAPAVCMLTLLLTCWWFSNVEILLVACVLIALIGLWNYSIMLTLAFLLEVYLVQRWREPYGKRLVASVALIVAMREFGEASLVAVATAVLVLLGVCYVLAMVVNLEESSYSSDDQGARPRATAGRAAGAGPRGKKEAKRDAKKAGRRK